MSKRGVVLPSTRTTWVDEYQEHACWTQLEGILEATAGVVPSEPAYIDRLNRIRLVAQAGLDIKDASPILVYPGALTALEQSASSVHAPLIKWKSDGHSNNSFLDQAYAQLPSLQSSLGELPAPASTSLRSAAATLRHAVRESSQSLETLNSYIDGLEAKQQTALDEHLATAESKFDALKERFEEFEVSVEATISKAESSAAALDTQLKTINTRSSEALESHQRQFLTAEEGRTKAHADLVAEHESDLKTKLNATQKSLDSHITESKATLAKELDAIKEARKSAEKTVGAIGVQATAKWYEENANSQRVTADKWRWIAAGLFVVAFLVVGYSVFISSHEDDSWKSTVLKSTATATLVAGAVYAQSESKKHRDEEFRSKTTELTLRALDPFIANLTPKLRTKLRTEAARQVFILSPGLDEMEQEEYDEDDEEFQTDS